MIKKISLLVFIFLFSIISLTITEDIKLKHNITTNIKQEKSLDITFSKVLLNNKDITNTSVSDNGKSIIFVIDSIDNNTNLIYQISNNSDKDVDINIKCSNTKQYNNYYTFTNNYDSKVLSKMQVNGSLLFNVNSEEKIKDMFMCKLDYK